MGLMITNDGVDADSDAVSGSNDYSNIWGCHDSDPFESFFTRDFLHNQLRQT